ncbi:MAG: threonylcarbamoyl-AMP synthase [Deltaproteobacteria bacterium]|nr:threonylcarbamoyl-AMP synthase [Deltaproteobacteria bacterium]
MIFPPTPENIARAADLIRQGKLVAFPTETVYGLGADATNDAAVQRIFEVKNRPTLNPLIVHVASLADIASVADLEGRSDLQDKLRSLQQFWPGPLSVVLPKGKSISSFACAGLPSVAVRIPDHAVALEFIRAAKRPIAAPSANRSSYVSPTTAQHVEAGLGAKIEMVLDGGACSVGLESTIVSLVSPNPVLLRPGAVTFEQLKAVLPELELSRSADTPEQPLSPGLLREHYAPSTKIVLKAKITPSEYPARVGLISFGQIEGSEQESRYSAVNVLSQSGDLSEIASKLFAAIREQDGLGLDLIVVDSCSEVGLGRAIMDRLLRATAKFT